MTPEGRRHFQEQILSGPSIDGRTALARFFAAVEFARNLRNLENGFETDMEIEELYSKSLFKTARFIEIVCTNLYDESTHISKYDALRELIVLAFLVEENSGHATNLLQTLAEGNSDDALFEILAGCHFRPGVVESAWAQLIFPQEMSSVIWQRTHSLLSFILGGLLHCSWRMLHPRPAALRLVRGGHRQDARI